MTLRESMLPFGWYPRNTAEIYKFLDGFERGTANAAIAPHAGWYYSGHIAARAVCALDPSCKTIIVIGGHLPAGRKTLFALEDSVQTPLGPVQIDKKIRNSLINRLDGIEDVYPDNTVEVLLPMIRYFFPDAAIVWMRLAAEKASFEAGKTISETVKESGYPVAVLASADLTHYGRNYGFFPKGTGQEALKWVMEVNDARFIGSVLENDVDEMLIRSNREKSCCSAGSVAGVMGFAENTGSARLLKYSSSAEKSEEIPDSFVGYAAIAWEDS